jgi:hypothetical protein
MNLRSHSLDKLRQIVTTGAHTAHKVKLTGARPAHQQKNGGGVTAAADWLRSRHAAANA